jgi:hypothetical protein
MNNPSGIDNPQKFHKAHYNITHHDTPNIRAKVTLKQFRKDLLRDENGAGRTKTEMEADVARNRNGMQASPDQPVRWPPT